VGKRADIRNSTLSGSRSFGVSGDYRAKVAITSSTIEGNVYGVANVRRVLLDASSVLNNSEGGVYAQSVRIEQSVMTGNGSVDGCDPLDCADIAAHRLRAVGVTCDRSSVRNWPAFGPTGETWGVCAKD
jgi:hypothetical protein